MNPDTLGFYLSKYFEYYPFFLPLGLLGIWRWSIWGFKKIVGYYYRPKSSGYEASVTVVTPVYNEDPKIFKKAINSWAKNKPKEIIAVIDYTDKSSIKIFKDFSIKNSFAKLIITQIPGKREALAAGIKKAKSEIVALVDSDTIWEDNTLINGIAPFSDEKIGGVTTRQSVLNPRTLAQKFFSIRLEQRYWDDIPFLAKAEDIIVCLSGRTSFYRKKALMPILNEMTEEKFFGEKVISGEDKRLTYLIEAAGWKTTYQSNANVLSTGAKDLKTFINQQIRWTRNSWRNDLRALYEGWTFKHPIFSLYLIDRAIQPFTLLISPIYFIISFLLKLWIPVIVILIWWHISRFIKMYPHLRKYPRDIIILPFFILFNFISTYIRIYSLVTINNQGWITRWDKSRLHKKSFYLNLVSHSATLVIVFAVAFLVYFNKYLNFLIPQQRQKQLLAKTLPQVETLAATKGTPTVLGISTVKEQVLLTKRHVFKLGDSLNSIAQQYDVTVGSLLAANSSKIVNWNRIEPGMSLTIPSPETELVLENRFNYQRIYPDILRIFYEQSIDHIVIYGRGKIITLKDIAEIVGKKYLEEIEPGVWDLKTSLYLGSGLTLKLNKESVRWLKMISNDKKFTRILAYNSDIFIDGVKITSWDQTKKDYDKNIKNGRSYILVKDGSRMDIKNSEIGYLGYSRPLEVPYSTYGISWRMSTGKLGRTILTGEITNSKFHDNYFGAYTFGATGMTWKKNEFYNNIRYGLDPHDDSNGFLVEDNVFRNNGSHGLIFSKRCINNIIRNNVSYNNKGHGIMLHELSNKNLIENNISYANTDGIALDHSSDNVLKNNKISENKRGVRANNSSVNNLIEDNTIKDNRQYGIYLYGNSNNNFIQKNILTNNPNAIYIKSTSNQALNNILNKNKVGIYFLGDASGNKVIGNTIIYNKLYGVYAKISTDLSNYIEKNNFIWRNKKDVVAEEIE